MTKQHSITGRIVIGKIIGFIIGIVVMLSLPLFDIPVMSMFGFASLLMFVLMGILTAFMGIFDYHPIFNFKLQWWLRGPIIGATFMLMYVLFTYDTIEIIMQSPSLSWMGLTSPFWAISDGLFLGAFMDFIETRMAWEWKNLAIA